MSVIGEFTVPARSLAMAETLARAPGVTVEIERVVAHERRSLTPYFWIRGGDREQFDDVVRADPSVENATRLDEYEDEALYRAEWKPDVESVGHAYLQTGATMLEALGRDESWELRLRFDRHDDVSEFYEYCETNDVPYEVSRIYDPTASGPGQFGVTAKQRKALLAARGAGFYDVPRGETMDDVAEAIGITQQALSKRLRRGHGKLVDALRTADRGESDG